MAIVKQCGYDYYVHKKYSGTSKSVNRKPLKNNFNNIFTVTASPRRMKDTGELFVQAITFPPEFIGKRIRLKIEIVDK